MMRFICCYDYVATFLVFICCVLDLGTLHIIRSVESDEGKYECVAENYVGVAYSYGANLYVRGKKKNVVLNN